MRYQVDLEKYTIKEISSHITEVTADTLDYNELSNTIDEFNKEINWKDMWDAAIAKKRLQSGWKMLIYTHENKIKGWYWLDNTGEPRNMYVDREHRNKGIGLQFHFKLMNICKEMGIKKIECSIDKWNITSIKSIKKAGWVQTSRLKIYIHHPYKKSLFYTICHNSIDRNSKIQNNEGSVFAKYKEIEIEFIFKKEISFETDGYHILDYFSAYFDNETDPKIGKILQDTTYMERENQQILKIFIDLLKDCPKNQKWIITYFRTEKILHSIDSESEILSEKFIELENLLNQLKDHHIVTDNVFLNNKIESTYLNFHFAFTNSIFQWNRNLNIRYYYELKEIFDRCNFEYDLVYSIRNHKGFRVNLINELNKLNNPKIYLQTSDTLGENLYYKTYGKEISNNINLNSIYGDSDFADISYLQNIINGLDLFFRVLLKGKMQILCESWSQVPKQYNSNYLSEKTIGFILAGIPFISTHDYPLLIIQKILNVPPHPFLEESSKCKSNAKLFSNFVKEFMDNFEENYNKCKDWSNLVHNAFMNKLENENSLLKLILEDRLNDTLPKKSLT